MVQPGTLLATGSSVARGASETAARLVKRAGGPALNQTEMRQLQIRCHGASADIECLRLKQHIVDTQAQLHEKLRQGRMQQKRAREDSSGAEKQQQRQAAAGGQQVRRGRGLREDRAARQGENGTAPEAASSSIDKGKPSFVFLSIFKWETRKGWDILLKAFLEEFWVSG